MSVTPDCVWGGDLERVYQNDRIGLRMGLLMMVIGGAGSIALWLLGIRYPATPADSSESEEVLFVGVVLLVVVVIGAIRVGYYGFMSVVRMDADEKNGRARLTLWRPLGQEVVETSLKDIIEWRYEVGRKNTKMPVRRFRARIVHPHRWLLFEVTPKQPLHPLIRKLAPQAVEEYELQTGIAAFRAGSDRAD
jgi:hypothetical protein